MHEGAQAAGRNAQHLRGLAVADEVVVVVHDAHNDASARDVAPPRRGRLHSGYR
jgi:hypothetical protein